MANYINEASEKYFTDLVGDNTFDEDLKSFFTGGRYNYTPEEINNISTGQLANDFVEHMRYQTSNEATAAKDLLYVSRNYRTDPNINRNLDAEIERYKVLYAAAQKEDKLTGGNRAAMIFNPEKNTKRKDSSIAESQARDIKFAEGKAAFGRLMLAYDSSQGGGTSNMETAGDYLRGFVTAPSTVGTVATLGFGVGGKIAAIASGKATQLSIRAIMAKQLKSNVAHTIVKEGVKKKFGREIAKTAAGTFAFEGAVGAASSYARNQTRDEVIEGYEYTKGDVTRDAIIDGSIGSSIGAVLKIFDVKSFNRASEMIFEQVRNGERLRRKGLNSANKTIKEAKPVDLKDSTDDIVEVVSILQAREKGVKLNPLDPELVEIGDGIRSLILTGKPNKELATTLSLESIKGITAASLEIKSRLKLKPGQRISSGIAEAIERGDIVTPDIVAIKKKYNLSNEMFSYIYLSDLSRAGKVLGQGSLISKSLTNIKLLTQEGLSSISEVEAADIFASIGGEVPGAVSKQRRSKFAEGASQIDNLRIAHMTSQLGTTAANVGTGVANTFIDISDRFWKNTIRLAVGETLEDGTYNRRWVGGTLSTLRGLSWNKSEAIVVKDMLMDEAPLQFRDLFYETVKGMDVSGSNSLLPKIGRFLNTLNIATDGVFKEAALYSGLDRRLRELNNSDIGTNLGEFLSKKKSDGSNMRLDDLPPGVMDYAIDSAQRFTFQKPFKKDTSLFGHGARAVQNLHHKVPFLISVGADVPFPRYIANHLEYVNDYSPIGIATGGIQALDEMMGGFSKVRKVTLVGGDPNKTMVDRVSRQITGSMLTLGAFGLAASKEGKVDFDRYVQETKSETDLSRMAGPFAINFLLGDALYRYSTGLPWNTTATLDNFREILGGVPDLRTGAFKFEFDLVKNMFASAKAGTATPELEKNLGNIISTFTYPPTFSRDFYSQFDYDSAGNPFTKDMMPGRTAGERNMLEDIIYSNLLKNQAARFLMDTPMFSYNQSYPKGERKGYDFKLYSIFNPEPIGAWNPMTKSFGAVEEPPSSAIQQEMTLLGMQDYKIFSSKDAPNPSIEYQLRYMLSQKMPTMFQTFKKSPLPGAFAGQTYDQLNFDKKRFALETFINQAVSTQSKAIVEQYDTMIKNPETKARAIGYIRNMYDLEKAVFERSYGDLNKLIKYFPTEFEGAESSKEYLENAGSIEEEINRRQHVLSFIPKYDFKSGMKLPIERSMTYYD